MRHIFSARMPQVNTRINVEEIFEKARQMAASEQPRQVVIVTPERRLIAKPCKAPGTASLNMTAPIKKLVPFEPPVNITVIGYTETQFFQQDPAACIPFLGYLMGMGYLGHHVVIFEGHESALGAGLKEADLLLVDEAMIPFLPVNWTAIAYQQMRTPRIMTFKRNGKVQTHPLPPVELPPHDYDSTLKYAHRLAKAGKFDEALPAYTKAIEFNPSSEQAYYNRGLMYLKQGQVDRAIEDFSQALQLKPTMFEALYQRGVAYALKDDFQGAFSDFNQALKLNRQSAQAYFQRGKILARKQKLEAAIIDFSTSIHIVPTLEALLERARAYEASDQVAEAIADYEQYLRAGGGHKLGNQTEIETRLRQLKAPTAI